MKSVKISEIYNYIKNKETVSVTSLEKDLKVPRTTLLRYLNELVNEGKIIKTFGEVQIRKSHKESLVAGRVNDNQKVKQAIALKAIKYVNDGDVIFLDAGSTTFYLAKQLANKEITIYTNNLLLTTLINEEYLPTINFVPGEVNKRTLAIASVQTIEALDGILFDKSFIGFNSLVGKELSTTNIEEATLKKTVIKNTKQGNSFVLGRTSKSAERSKYKFASKEEVKIITEE